MADQKQVVVVTGASAGVGRATARAFGHKGASVGLIARDEYRLNLTKTEIEQLGGRALVISADVTDYALVEAAAERVETSLVLLIFGSITRWRPSARLLTRSLRTSSRGQPR